MILYTFAMAMNVRNHKTRRMDLIVIKTFSLHPSSLCFLYWISFPCYFRDMQRYLCVCLVDGDWRIPATRKQHNKLDRSSAITAAYTKTESIIIKLTAFIFEKLKCTYIPCSAHTNTCNIKVLLFTLLKH